MFNFFSRKNRNREEDIVKEIETVRDEACQKIIYLEKELERKKWEIEKLKQELLKSNKGERAKTKQDEIIEKNLRDMKRDNDSLKEKIALLETKNIFGDLPPEEHIYKIAVEKYYALSKYSLFLEILQNKGKNFMCQLEKEDFIGMENIKNYSEILKLYERFNQGKIDIEYKILALKGEKIGRVYSKNRKFINYIVDMEMEFMEELKKFDFSTLTNCDFKDEQVKEFIQKNNEYQNRFRR
ncbi:MAG: hypothetical protein ACRCZ9_07055 [Fusobacteriaceae bacterium]